MKPDTTRPIPVRRGITLVQLLVALAILAALLYCGIKVATAPKAVAAITVQGPTILRRGQTDTFTVAVQADTILSTSERTAVEVQIWEDDYTRDQLLIKTVTVYVPAGRKIGRAKFVLTCDANTGELVGADGRAKAEATWHIYGFTERQDAVDTFSGANSVLRCPTD